MKKHVPQIVATVLFATLSLVAGCSDKEEPAPPPGPAEQVGRESDNTMRQAIDRAKEVQKELGKKVEQAGKELQRTEKTDQDE
jgi:hypothetical protein